MSNIEACEPKDSDVCLWESGRWMYYETCAKSTKKCNHKWWEKDMRRCCPESCGTGSFTEEDCVAFEDKGISPGTTSQCRYPNQAQCEGRKLQSKLLLR